MSKVSVIFIPFSDTLPGQAGQNNASTRFRCYQNARALRKLGWTCEVGTGEKIGRISDFDIVVFQKRYFKIAYELAKKFKGKVILDLSDPDWIKFPNRKKLIDNMAKCAVHITTSSTKLANHFLKEGYDSTCITEGFDFETVPHISEKERMLSICWHGNSKNTEYLRLIVEPLNKLHKEFGFALKLVVNLPSADIPKLNFPIRVVRWGLETHLKEIAKCHIGIAPLALDEWCSYKCPHKLFTYMALGLPFVASSIQSYEEVIKNGTCGYLIKNNNLEDWYKSLKTLMTDVKKRESMAEEGKRLVKNYSVDKMAKKWDILLKSL